MSSMRFFSPEFLKGLLVLVIIFHAFPRIDAGGLVVHPNHRLLLLREMRYCRFHHPWVDLAGRQKANGQERWNTGHAYRRGPQARCRHHEKPAVLPQACMARGHRPHPGAGFGPSETRRGTGKPIPTVQRRRKRFPAEGVDGLPSNATRPPGRAPIPGERAKAPTGVAMSPPLHLSHWTLSALAEGTGTVRPTIHNIPGDTGRHRPDPGHPGCRGIPVAGGRHTIQRDCTSILPNVPSCCRWTGNGGSRRCRAHRGHCRRGRASREPARTPAGETAPPA